MSRIGIGLDGTVGSVWEVGELEQSEVSVSRHDIRQPLNIMMLACANLRARIAPRLDPEDAVYLDAKIGRIEEQVVRISEMLGASATGVAPDAGAAASERD